MEKMIYLDNASTTKPYPEAIQAAMPYLTDLWGNASSSYQFGQKARDAIENARVDIADTLGASPGQIFFTSGATESNNTVLKGMQWDRVFTTPIEHHAVIRPADSVRVRLYLPVGKTGRVNPQTLQKRLRELSGTTLVSVMAANNEIGTIQPIKDIAQICRQSGAYFHTDATQYYGHQLLDVDNIKADFISASAHKFGGVKGCGFLYVREGYALDSLLQGGLQEKGFRAGTQNVFGIVAMAEAAKISCRKIGEESARLIELRSYLTGRVLNQIEGSKLTGDPVYRLPNNASFIFEGVRGEELVELLGAYGICSSSGSACETGSNQPSHVLRAIKLSDEQANGSLRLTLGIDTTREDLEYTVEKIKSSINILKNRVV